MTQTAAEPPRKPDYRSPTRRAADAETRAGRWPVVAALILGLVGAGFTQNWASDWKDSHAGNQQQQQRRQQIAEQPLVDAGRAPGLL